MIVTRQVLQQIWPKAPTKWVDAMSAIMPKWGIDTPLRIAHFTAQIGHESSDLTRLEENLRYTAARLMTIWPKRFPTLKSTKKYAWDPKTPEPEDEALANFVYGARLGNELNGIGDGDGWDYRGRGPIQITGRANYKAAGAAIGVDLVSAPEQVLLPTVGSTVACWYWKSRGLNELADLDQIDKITLRINGGLIGLQDRANRVARAKALLGA